MAEKETRITCNFMPDSVKVISESASIGSLPDDACSEIAADCTYRLKQTIQEAVKFMHHAKRHKLTTKDIDHALRCENVEPLYGFHAPDLIPFRYASGGGRELHFTEDKDHDLSDIINLALPRVPLDVSIRPHWLCVDGVQPATPDNPPPMSKDAQKQQVLDMPAAKAPEARPKPEKHRHKVKGGELVKMKDIAMHELSVEQQLFYKEITEACVGSNELRRSEALQSLATDPGLHQMLPRFSTFVSEGVKINVVQFNLAFLIYLMRMVKAIMDNPTLYLEKYLHELIPGILTCIVSKQLCMRPDIDNHWALRDFAARLIGSLCKNFSSCVNNTQARVTKTFSAALQGDKAALATQYGAIGGMGELGNEVIKTFLMPHVKCLSNRIQQITEGQMYSNNDKISADHIKKSLVKYVSGVLKTSRAATDTVEDYVRDYGSLGALLHAAVVRERQLTTSTRPATQSRPLSSPLSTAHAAPLTTNLAPTAVASPGIQGQKYVYITQGGRGRGTPTSSLMKIITTGGSNTTPTVPLSSAAVNQKIMVMHKPATTAVSGMNTNVKVIKPGEGGGGYNSGVSITRVAVGSSTQPLDTTSTTNTPSSQSLD